MSQEATPAILEELRSLRERMDELYALVSGGVRGPEPARAGDLVDVDYVCRVTGLARVTVMQGKSGVSELPLQGTRPKRWLKSDVDRFQRQRAAALQSPRQKALRVVEGKSA